MYRLDEYDRPHRPQPNALDRGTKYHQSITRKHSGLADGYPALVTLPVVLLVILRPHVSLLLWKDPVF
jgi:hypothetical protein